MSSVRFRPNEIERLRQRWDQGDMRAVAEGFTLCAPRDEPFPDWLTQAVLAALIFAFNKGGSTGRGRAGHNVRAKRRDIHENRHGWAKVYLEHRAELPNSKDRRGEPYPATREGAFLFVSDMLAGTFARGSARTIERSFERIEKEKRALIT